ncbi:hypothetical protein Scep_021820 [Stephania cephalantha]|uniref:Uncharacterized protein n=1 Tax=Stephania cephalantha TaxID=152367 RepID=A0AAP0F457_9MAGN
MARVNVPSAETYLVPFSSQPRIREFFRTIFSSLMCSKTKIHHNEETIASNERTLQCYNSMSERRHVSCLRDLRRSVAFHSIFAVAISHLDLQPS